MLGSNGFCACCLLIGTPACRTSELGRRSGFTQVGASAFRPVQSLTSTRAEITDPEPSRCIAFYPSRIGVRRLAAGCNLFALTKMIALIVHPRAGELGQGGKTTVWMAARKIHFDIPNGTRRCASSSQSAKLTHLRLSWIVRRFTSPSLGHLRRTSGSR